MSAKVYVYLKNGVLDPQGQAIAHALNRTGYSFVKDVRVSKVFEIETDGNASDYKEQINRLADEMLANPIIETFRIELED